MKIKNKKLVAIVALVVIVAAMCLGAYAYFTDYARVYKTGKAGTLEINVTDLTEAFTKDSSDPDSVLFIPGVPQEFSFTVKNTAEKSTDAKAVITLTYDREITPENPEVIIMDLDGNVLTGELSNGNKTISYTTYEVTLNGSIEEEDGVTEKSHTYTYQMIFSEDADVSWEGFTMDGNLEVYAKQHRNTEGVGADWIKIVE